MEHQLNQNEIKVMYEAGIIQRTHEDDVYVCAKNNPFYPEVRVNDIVLASEE